MRRVKFVCEGNIHRSRTAADLYAGTPGVEARSAGLADSARVRVCEELIAWADAIFVMEARLESLVRRRFRAALADKELVCLDIADDYQYMQPEPCAVLSEKLAPRLGHPGAGLTA